MLNVISILQNLRRAALTPYQLVQKSYLQDTITEVDGLLWDLRVSVSKSHAHPVAGMLPDP